MEHMTTKPLELQSGRRGEVPHVPQTRLAGFVKSGPEQVSSSWVIVIRIQTRCNWAYSPALFEKLCRRLLTPAFSQISAEWRPLQQQTPYLGLSLSGSCLHWYLHRRKSKTHAEACDTAEEEPLRNCRVFSQVNNQNELESIEKPSELPNVSVFWNNFLPLCELFG